MSFLEIDPIEDCCDSLPKDDLETEGEEFYHRVVIGVIQLLGKVEDHG